MISAAVAVKVEALLNKRIPLFSRWLSLTFISSSILVAGCGGGSGSSSLPTRASSASSVTAVTAASSQTAAVARKAMANVTYSSTALADGAQAYYQLNDTTSTLADSGPNALSGTYQSGVTHNNPTLTTGGISSAGFNGGSVYDPTMYGIVPPSPSLMPTTLSLEAWIKTGQYNVPKKYLPIVLYGRYANGARYGFFVTPQNGLMYTQRNVGLAAVYASGGVTLIPGTVYHCLATSDGTNIKLYVNGKLQSTVAYAGSPDYANSGNEGLYFGGALNSGLDSFNGSISQVAVYNSALTGTQALNHFVAGQLAPMITEPATSADGFVDSIGVNTHFTDYNSLYGTNYTQAKAVLTGLGVRHIRDGMFTQSNPREVQQYNDLGASGIHGLFSTDLSMTQSTIIGFPALVGSMFEAYEAPNEQDDVGNPNWLPQCKAFQQNLYSWVKGNAATSNYPVVGPVLVSQASYSMLGDVSAYMDYGNVHDYMNPYNPGTPGWGSVTPYGIYGSIDYNLGIVKVTSGSKPIYATETGYGTVIPGTIDNYTLLRYMPRLFFEQANHAIVRTYSYELLDDGGDGTQMFQTFGLVNHDFTPKPAYTALKGIISALNDPGASFTPKALTYQFVGNTNGVVHRLLGKRNGSYTFAVWIEVPSWDVNHNVDISVPTQSMTLNTTGTFSKATISAPDPNGNMVSTPLAWSGTSATFTVSDAVSLVTITP